MKKCKNLSFTVFLLLACMLGLMACSSKKSTDADSDVSGNLIYEETVSPNKEYVENEEDIVTYTVKIYQDKDHTILVHSESNSEFFEPLQYKMEYDADIVRSDIDMEWTTLMGNPSPTTEDDQLAIAYVSISKDGELLDKRKISFVNRGVEIIESVLAQ